VSQYIKLGDLTAERPAVTNGYTEAMDIAIQSPAIEEYPEGVEPGMNTTLSKEQEDVLLKHSTGDLPDWIANFIRRVILLLENLPEEGENGADDGTTEGCFLLHIMFTRAYFIAFT
jgi:proteasome activator subunit 4